MIKVAHYHPFLGVPVHVVAGHFFRDQVGARAVRREAKPRGRAAPGV